MGFLDALIDQLWGAWSLGKDGDGAPGGPSKKLGNPGSASEPLVTQAPEQPVDVWEAWKLAKGGTADIPVNDPPTPGDSA